MTYIVSGGALNSTHSLTHCCCLSDASMSWLSFLVFYFIFLNGYTFDSVTDVCHFQKNGFQESN